jgi:hypothetical protein
MGFGKQLRRALATALVGLAAALVAPAAASAATYTGSFPDGGTLSFSTVTKDGKVVRVKSFAWKKVPISCDQGDFTYSAQLPFSISVKNRAFSIKATGLGVIQSVSGRLTHQRQRANGTLNVFGDLGLTRTNCSTGDLTWTAVRG